MVSQLLCRIDALTSRHHLYGENWKPSAAILLFYARLATPCFLAKKPVLNSLQLVEIDFGQLT